MMLHIYIDTNVLLRFYAYSDDALTEIEKLAALIASGQVHSYTTEQTIDELYRNRDTEIAESIKRLEGITTSVEIPRFAYVFDESTALTNAVKSVKEGKSALLQKVKDSLSNGNLKADHIIEEIFKASELLKRTAETVSRAEMRFKLGNPPGKGNGIGDQINWECLLDQVPNSTELHVISRDGDYSAKDDRGRISYFLMREWQKAKGAEAILYQGLGAFTKKHFPEIKVPTDAVKQAAIKSLISSGTFANTHAQIAVLSKIFDEIVTKEALAILQALVDNTQIRSICKDEDLKNFFTKLYKKFYLDTPTAVDEALEEAADYLGVPF